MLLIAYQALSTTEQEKTFELIHDARLQRLAGEDTETGRILASLKRVADLIGEAPGVEDYTRIRRQLIEDGEQLEPVSRIVKHFNGSWHLAREAISLSEITTPRRIDARFASRKLGKVWRYTDASLRETIKRCTSDLGHVPQVAEFDHWRQRELELAKARGEDLHLPSARPYRRRWGSWEAALIDLGYSESEIQGRLERT
ncbi:MAG TPA: hypothetical protein VLL27_02085 [Solirubrobacterales bacterium]|nr:hypothetical protein [Solirubrobacterales bacterium]